MKKAANVFIIIAMVLGFPAIIPLIVGGIALTKLEDATSASELTGIAVATLLFCSPIAGIIMLCLEDGDLEDDDDAEEDGAEE